MKQERRTAILIGGVRFDPNARTILTSGGESRLSRRAVGVLSALVEAEGQILHRQVLLDRVWADAQVGEENLTQAISELRRAMDDSSSCTSPIETIRGTGYRLREAARPAERAPPRRSSAIRKVQEGPIALDDPERTLEANLQVLEARRLGRQAGFRAGEEMLALVDDATQKAPGLVSAKAELASMLTGWAEHSGLGKDHRSRALETARQAVQLNPASAQAQRALGYSASALGLQAQARGAFSRAIQADPMDADTFYLASQAFFCSGDRRTALVMAERSAALRPTDYRPTYLAARAAQGLGDVRRAHRNAQLCRDVTRQRLTSAGPEPRVVSTHRVVSAMLGPLPDTTLLDAVREGEPAYFYDAATLLHAGEVGAAIDKIAELLDTGWRYMSYLRTDPLHAQLADHRRYRKLIDRLGPD